MDKSKVQKALELVKGKLSNGATVFGYEMEQIEAALEDAFEAEKQSKASEEKE